MALEKSDSSVQKEIKEIADTILGLFKLAEEVKKRYPEIYKLMADAEQITEDNYLIEYYNNQFKNHFFDSLERNRINDKPRRWIYLKMNVMKQLKDIDTYLIP